MYAQYPMYQGGGAGASFSTQQAGQTWDGRSWVPAPAPAGQPPPQHNYNPGAAYYTSAGVSTYQQPPVPQQPHQPSNTADLIRTYTDYYNEFTTLVAQQEVTVQRSAPQDQPHAESLLQWFKYYQGLSQHAAHWFYQNPQQTTPPFSLPPSPQSFLAQQQQQRSQPPSQAPPPQTGPPQHNNHHNSQPASSTLRPSDAPNSAPIPHPRICNEAPKPQPQQRPQEDPTQSPHSLKRYVDRCLQQCQTPDQKTAMMTRIEHAIQGAVQNGTLHSKNWDQEPVPRLATTASGVSNTKNRDEIDLHDSDFASPSSVTTKGSLGPLISPPPVASSLSVPPCRSAGMGATSSSSSVIVSSHSSHSNPMPSDKFRVPLINPKKRKNPSYDRTPPVTLSAAKNDYYGPVMTTTNTSTRQFSQSDKHSYYGPPSPTPSSKSASTVTSDDFIAVPQSAHHHNKHRKVERKGSGFNQSSSSLNERAKRFAGRGGLKDVAKDVKSVPGFDRYMGKSTIGGTNVQLDETDYELMKVKGTCLTLEKDYLRLTAPPRAELVRPQPILEQHLANLKAERQRPSNSRRDYTWFCSQLKAIRQDCTVQHLRNALAVDAYETHARVALEEGDLNEYNQCQTQLKELYLLLENDSKAVAHRNEFIAYRLLYYIFLTGNKKYDGGSSDLFKIMDSLQPAERLDPAIQHALSVRMAVSEFDYHAFFRLRTNSPNLGIFLMDRIAPSMRFNALLRICKAYRPSVEIAFVLKELGFGSAASSSSAASEGVEHGRAWLESCGCVMTEEGSMWSTKDTVLRESDMEEKRSLI